MSIRITPPAGLMVALAAGLLALPACKKQPDADDDNPTLGLTDTRARMISQNNLKQIGLAFHNHESANGTFPAGVYGPDGKSVGLSWRVQILPYLEAEGNRLFQQFKLNEPWDSPHNKTLIDQMPGVYAPPGNVGKPGMTYYRAFAGPEAALPPPRKDLRGTPGLSIQGRRMWDFTDGTSNTILVAEAGSPVVWTKPEELEYTRGGPLPQLGGMFAKGTNVLFADGSVRFFPTTTPESVLPGLITVNGGEVVNIP